MKTCTAHAAETSQPAAGESSFPHCHRTSHSDNKHYSVSLCSVNRPFCEHAESEKVFNQHFHSHFFSPHHWFFHGKRSKYICIDAAMRRLWVHKTVCLRSRKETWKKIHPQQWLLIHRWQIVKFSLCLCHLKITGFCALAFIVMTTQCFLFIVI